MNSPLLTQLTIKNYALIDHLSLTLNHGLTTITGETGAGKSIILGALGLVLGNRFDTTALMDHNQKCVIEAEFNLANYNLKDFFDANDLDYEQWTIIRRELTPSGKSRAFVNDTPVTLGVLQDLKLHLIDIHAQHETLQLNTAGFQYRVLDDLADTHALVVDYQNLKKNYESTQRELEALEQSIDAERAQHDYHTFLYDELVQSKIETGTLEQLEHEQERLSHIDLIQQNLLTVHQALNADNTGLTEQLYPVKEALSRIQNYDARYVDLFKRLNAVYVELDDVSREVALILENEDFSTSDLDMINERIHHIHLLFQKHKVNSEEDLLAVQSELAEKVRLITDADEVLTTKRQELKTIENELLTMAGTISAQRQQYIPEFEQQVTAILTNLGMKDARFKVELTETNSFNPYGTDDLRWLFSANKGATPASLKKVASGGELSRVMLAIKSIWAQKAQLPTIIFDEIDTGISGEVALKMADILKVLAQHLQVISITHLPQIAAKGEQHYKVYKTSDEVTTTGIRLLSDEDRQREIAEMLGGKTLTATALNHAAELLK
ncbi:MAG: DNA repair protein RecN [Flavobacteriales bacterium]|nr:MAG: DNA repair protein RecN [Flavobacteriales bacterium]